MASIGLLASCPSGADDQLGPRVDVSCRPFDFTLLFEDAFLAALPAGVFPLLLPPRFQTLWKTPPKMTSFQLATLKLGTLSILLVFELLFLIFRTQTPHLFTRMSVASGILSSIAILGAGAQSILGDQRSKNPSDTLVIYFSASAVLFVARLRSLCLIPADYIPRAMWIIVFICTSLVVALESARKVRFLRPLYQSATAEQLASFWNRSLFIWVLPFFQDGHSRVLVLADIPKVDEEHEEESTRTKLNASWDRTSGRYRLIRATFHAYSWPFLSAIIPRLVLSAFTFCQPFLIESSVSFIRTGSADSQTPYGQALVGGVVLVYFGIAVSNYAANILALPCTNRLAQDFSSSILASDLPLHN